MKVRTAKYDVRMCKFERTLWVSDAQISTHNSIICLGLGIAPKVQLGSRSLHHDSKIGINLQTRLNRELEEMNNANNVKITEKPQNQGEYRHKYHNYTKSPSIPGVTKAGKVLNALSKQKEPPKFPASEVASGKNFENPASAAMLENNASQIILQKRRNTMKHPETLPGGRNANQAASKNTTNNTFSKRSNVMSSKNLFRTAISVVVILIIASLTVFGQGSIINTGNWTTTGVTKAKDFKNSGAAATYANSGVSSALWIKNTLITSDNGALPANFDVKTGTVRYFKAGAQTINDSVKEATYANLYLTGSVDAKTLNGAITLTGVATADASAFNISTYKVTASGVQTPFVSANSGTFTFNSGEVEYSRTNIQDVYSTSYATLTVSGSGAKTMAGNVTVGTALNINAGTLAIGAGNELVANGSISDNSGAGTITGSTTSDLTLGTSGALTLPAIVGANLGAFTFAKGDGNTIETQSNITVNGALTATSGTLDVNSYTLTLMNTVTGTTGGFASNNNGYVVYGKTTDGQNVFAAQYGNLTFSNYAKTLPNGGNVQIAGTFAAGSSPNAHTVTNSTITFNSSSAGQSIPTFNAGGVGYNHVVTANANKTVGGNLTIAGNFTNGASVTTNVGTYTLAITGTKSQGNDAATMQFGGLNNGVIFGTGTVEYNAAGAQTIKGSASETYAFLTLSTSGTKTISDATSGGLVRTTSNLSVGNVTLSVAADGNLQVDGDMNNAGTVTNAGAITVGAGL